MRFIGKDEACGRGTGGEGMTEVWQAIPSAPGYEASTDGRIRSVNRVIATRQGRSNSTNRHKMSRRVALTGGAA